MHFDNKNFGTGVCTLFKTLNWYNFLQTHGRVHFSVDQRETKPTTPKQGNKLSKSISFASTPAPFGLKRSKSFHSTESFSNRTSKAIDISELGKFPPEIQDTIFKAIDSRAKYFHIACRKPRIR